MASPPHKSPTLYSYLGINVEEYYSSDTDVLSGRTMSDSPLQEATPRTAPNLLAESGNASAPLAQHQTTHLGDAITTNLIDEQQQLVIQQDESARRRTQLLRPFRVAVAKCSLHPKCKKVYAKR